MKEPYSRHAPRTESAAFVHPTAVIMGDVTLEEGCTVWPQAVLRGDAQKSLRTASSPHCHRHHIFGTSQPHQ